MSVNTNFNVYDLSYEEFVKRGFVKIIDNKATLERYKKCYEVSFSDNYTIAS